MSLEKTGSADTFIGTMAEKLGAVARAATVFGEPVERDGITVIQARSSDFSDAVFGSSEMKSPSLP